MSQDKGTGCWQKCSLPQLNLLTRPGFFKPVRFSVGYQSVNCGYQWETGTDQGWKLPGHHWNFRCLDTFKVSPDWVGPGLFFCWSVIYLYYRDRKDTAWAKLLAGWKRTVRVNNTGSIFSLCIQSFIFKYRHFICYPVGWKSLIRLHSISEKYKKSSC